jgi:excisionase family DNA binding protein
MGVIALEYKTIDEVAIMLKVSKRTVYDWIKKKKLRAVKAGMFWRIPEDAIQEFLKRPDKE